mmetsp:Transcript_3553/g.6729  ORF Transcript_3553/g.6729 Transcript_3553/m.6729 type:complete len:135 (+) Transcript_3553:2149-2553(+)
MSNGLSNTGAAAQIEEFVVKIFRGSGPLGVLFGIYLATALLSAVITNNAAIALMFPIVAAKGTGIADLQNLDKYAALYTMMVAASSSFSTPVGYQTNLMVHVFFFATTSIPTNNRSTPPACDLNKEVGSKESHI